MPANLRFGIPSLDAIFVGETERRIRESSTCATGGGIRLSERSEGTSVCLIGPDGTGKSVFSMHLASQYLWDLLNESSTTRAFPKVLYISTDLRFEMAERMFANFRLGVSVAERNNNSEPTVCLRQLATANAAHLTDFLLGTSNREIGFVDLASDSAGDDWALVTRIVSLLPEQDAQCNARHLVVLDAVEGLETLAGETDAYGQKVSRRARIALLMRLASHKCHLALVVEEAQESQRLPEEFVADIVVRLRSLLVNGYTRRTLEIEKARGQSHHARGQHPFQIRSGDQTSPPHVTIYPSLHYQGNSLRKRTRERENDPLTSGRQSTRVTSEVVSFGIRHLDSLLRAGPDGRFGLHAGMPFALIGDKGTFKSHLSDAFIAGCLADLARDFEDPELDKADWVRCWQSFPASGGIGVLCTSKVRDDLNQSLTRQLLNSNLLAARLLRNSPALKKRFTQFISRSIKERVIVDPLVIQDQPGPRLFHRIEALAQLAKDKLALTPSQRDEPHRIRMVFDDISAFRDAYPELHEDPLLLPLVIQLLRLEGFSSLFVATQPMQLGSTQLSAFDSALRSQVEGYLTTWRVSFFGEARTAITFFAGTEADRQPTTREVLQLGADSDQEPLAADVDPEFELYHGLETGNPQPVPLEIRFYIETAAFERYVVRENELLSNLFQSSQSRSDNKIITGVGTDSYEALRDYCYLNASGKLLTTLILQVDEFWRPAKRLGMLADLGTYVTSKVDGDEGVDRYEDPYALFRIESRSRGGVGPGAVGHYPSVRTRRDFFPEFRRPGPTKEVLIDRVPFTWDFGFLLLSHNDWYAAASSRLPMLMRSITGQIDKIVLQGEPGQSGTVDDRYEPRTTEQRPSERASQNRFQELTVGTVLDALRKPLNHLAVRPGQTVAADREVLRNFQEMGVLFRGPSSWRVVIEAAGETKRRRTSRDTRAVRSFDVARPSSESFSSLVFEIWLSEILERYSWQIRRPAAKAAPNNAEAETFIRKLSSFDADEQFSLGDLLAKHWRELYSTWMLLVEAIDFDALVDRDHRFSFRTTRDSVPSMAARHWYKTATEAPSAMYSEDPALPTRLPGYFSTRGDWYLAMAAGSRSYRLGHRALDLLNSRRANISRLQQGLGLPVRDVIDPSAFRQFRTRLSYVNYRGRRSTVSYESLIGLGGDDTLDFLCDGLKPESPDKEIDLARTPFGGGRNGRPESFFWVWRSRIRDYDRQSRIWSKWLIRVALLMQGIRNDSSAEWRSGFEVYDRIALSDDIPDDVRGLHSFERFEGVVNFLKTELGWAERTK